MYFNIFKYKKLKLLTYCYDCIIITTYINIINGTQHYEQDNKNI